MFLSPIPQPCYGSHPPSHSGLKTIILIQCLIHPQREIIFFARSPSDEGRSECRESWIWEGCGNLLKDTNNPGARFLRPVLCVNRRETTAGLCFLEPFQSKHPQAVAGLSAHNETHCNLSLSSTGAPPTTPLSGPHIS